jgi:hypothetical protein
MRRLLLAEILEDFEDSLDAATNVKGGQERRSHAERRDRFDRAEPAIAQNERFVIRPHDQTAAAAR